MDEVTRILTAIEQGDARADDHDRSVVAGTFAAN
jgi:hypothetical protein